MARDYTVRTSSLGLMQSGPRPVPIGGADTFDLIEGDDNANFLYGGEGNDTIRGFDGDDFMSGLAGIDNMYGGGGNDSAQGGLDVDNIFGGNGNDSLQGTAFGAILSTGGPCDVIDGGSGIDVLMVNYDGWINSGTSQPINVTVDITTGTGEVQVDGFRGEAFSQMERLNFVGPDGDDHVTGGNLDDVIFGELGDDVIRAKDGNDLVKDGGGFIDANGGNGTDTFWLDISAAGLTDTVIDVGAGTFTVGANDMGAFVNFEAFQIFGSSGTDTIHGHDTIGCSLIGWTGNDFIYGGSGNDSINGDMPIFFGGGNDEIHGGDGNDSIQDINGNNILDGGGGNDSIVTVGIIDTITGGSGDDHLGWRVNVAQPGGSLDGGSGWDRLSFDVPEGTFDITAFDIERYEELVEFLPSAYTCTLTTDQFHQFDEINMPSALGMLSLADNADVLMPELSHFGGLQLANGGQTVDASGIGDNSWTTWIIGGDGNDTLISTDAEFEERFDFYGGGGNDRLVGGDTWEEAEGGDGNDRLNGAGGEDILIGNAGKDTLTGGGGDDTIEGGADADVLDGGGGFDDFVYSDVSESTGTKLDTIKNFDLNFDEVIVPFEFEVTDAVEGGTLSQATFNDDLKAAIGKQQLGIHELVIFTPDAGDYAGQVFVIIEANDKKGYQKNADYVIRFDNPNFEFDGGGFI
jgi:Ca2+-binding RTX toxin-like protein